MVTATRRRNLEAPSTPSVDSESASTITSGKRKPESTRSGKPETQRNKRRKRSNLAESEEMEGDSSVEASEALDVSISQQEEETATAAKKNHFRFDSEEPEVPPRLDMDVPKPQQEDRDVEDSSDDDEAPETVDNSAQLSKFKLEAKKQERAKQIEEQRKKEKRKQLDELRKSQAKNKEMLNAKTKSAAGTADDMLSESTETLRGSTTQDARRSALPALLPDDILNAAPVTRLPTPPAEEYATSHKKPNKLRFLEATEKRPKDVKLGDVTIRVLDESVSHKAKTSLPPKSSKTGRNAKQNWLNRARSTANINGLRRTTGGSSGFVRR
ncbi:uncharacterized protein ACLA_071000 [Aspergillus clavatus NRRL 1]|uniref:Immediate-early protein n=1 Tax=Aspergillus clavatus (strain ATCC 1007 / CBS 513.65 / DSM 816 / NCTC 3887 / NRRL 1 / QM 1276 / 107) TaxID=344612 RepID=A1C6P6_ASPCL|nr:uncharacterized protein ACLA_071000 [Aspergillus clavatus NRRL 1]EAW14067.1 conserved hypothetical protein [Aspergillus clavatus NRRL 1]